MQKPTDGRSSRQGALTTPEKPSTRAYLAKAMSGEPLTADDIDNLVPRDEGLQLEFKNGKLAADRESPFKVRRHVSAFANSEGGLLILGVEDKGHAVTGVEVRGGNAVEWASRVLQPLSPWLAPSPRIHTVSHAAGEVLVIAVQRAPALVPVVNDGRMAYYLRIGESSAQAPEYLISDLLLGHRRHPVLDVRPDITCDAPAPFDFSIGIAFDVENCSLVPAPAPTIGVVVWTTSLVKIGRAPTALLEWVEVKDPNPALGVGAAPMVLGLAAARNQSGKDEGSTIHSFETVRITRGGLIHISARHGARLRAAVYAQALGHRPEWYQLEVVIKPDSVGRAPSVEARMEKAVGAPPVVAYELIRSE